MPDYFVNAQTLSPADHLAVQAAAQRHIDSSISKTINVPAGISFEEFKGVYLSAYELGCKGCTTYRPNEVTGSVLRMTDAPPAHAPEEPVTFTAPPRPRESSGGVVYMTRPLDRPEVLIGQTYKIKWLDSDHAFYITVNDIEKDGRRRPFEVFINSKNMEAYAWAVALTRMISAVFRRGGDVSFVVDELKAIFDPRGGQWSGRTLCPLAHGRDRRSDRKAHDRYRIHRLAVLRTADAGASGRRRCRRGCTGALLPTLLLAQLRQDGRLRYVSCLRLFALRLTG